MMKNSTSPCLKSVRKMLYFQLSEKFTQICGTESFLPNSGNGTKLLSNVLNRRKNRILKPGSKTSQIMRRKKRKEKNYKIRGDENGGDLNAKWRSANWDTSKLCHVLVDSKLFKLEEINVQLSSHIVSLREIRNKIAHFTAYAISNEILADNVKEITDHINGLTCVIKTDPYLNIIQDIKNSQKPKSVEQQAKLKQEYEALKHLCQLHVHEKELSNLRVMLLQEKDKNEQLESESKEELAKVNKDFKQEREKYVTLGEKLQQERDQLNKQKDSTEKELKMSQHENQAKSEEIFKMKDEIAKLKRGLEQEQRENKNHVADMLKMKDEILELKFKLESEIKSKEKNMQSLETENSSLKQENSDHKEQRSQMLNKNNDLKQKVNTSKNLHWENKIKDREILKLKEENGNLNRRLCKSKRKKDIQVKDLEKVKEENECFKWANLTAQTINLKQTEEKNELIEEHEMLRNRLSNLEQVLETLANVQSSKKSSQHITCNQLEYCNQTDLNLKSKLYEEFENHQEKQNMNVAINIANPVGKLYLVYYETPIGNSTNTAKIAPTFSMEQGYVPHGFPIGNTCSMITNTAKTAPTFSMEQGYVPHGFPTIKNLNDSKKLKVKMLPADPSTNINSVSEQMSTLREKCNKLETENKQVLMRLSKEESRAEETEKEMLKLQDIVYKLEKTIHHEENTNVGILEKLRKENELRKNAERQSNECEEEINHLKHKVLQTVNQRPRDLQEDSSNRQENAHLREQLRKMEEENRKMEEKLKHAKKMLHSQIDDFFDGN